MLKHFSAVFHSVMEGKYFKENICKKNGKKKIFLLIFKERKKDRDRKRDVINGEKKSFIIIFV